MFFSVSLGHHRARSTGPTPSTRSSRSQVRRGSLCLVWSKASTAAQGMACRRVTRSVSLRTNGGSALLFSRKSRRTLPSQTSRTSNRLGTRPCKGVGRATRAQFLRIAEYALLLNLVRKSCCTPKQTSRPGRRLSSSLAAALSYTERLHRSCPRPLSSRTLFPHTLQVWSRSGGASSSHALRRGRRSNPPNPPSRPARNGPGNIRSPLPSPRSSRRLQSRGSLGA